VECRTDRLAHLVRVGELDLEGGEAHQVQVEGVRGLDVPEQGVLLEVVLGPVSQVGGMSHVLRSSTMPGVQHNQHIMHVVGYVCGA
jgi:hypothetical protein